ncbi:apoptosis-antagonizing transcription factor [Trametes punicea]|nr:apoptosis-antagonizing transcription factor [Trametes punicea]
MAARISLKDQLAELSQAAPIDLDPEDALAPNDPSHESHRLSSIDDPAAREHYIDVAPSAIRKLHDSVSDPKYDGVRTSRKQLYDDSDNGSHNDDMTEEGEADEDDEEYSQSEAGTEQQDVLVSPAEDEDDLSDDPSGSGSDDDDRDVEHDETSPSRATSQNQVNEASSSLSRIDISSGQVSAHSAESQQADNDVASNLRKTHEADKKKGKAVSRQIALWDTLLDARIQLHKAVTAANRLPLPHEVERYVSHPSAREALDGFFDVADSLIEELYSLQEDLLRFNESIEPPARKRRKLDRPAASHSNTNTLASYSDAAIALSASASALEASYHPWLVDTLSKWSAKVQAVAPNVLLPDNKGSFMRDPKSGAHVGVVTLIDDIFRADRSKLLDRTRKRKDKHSRLGHARPSSEDGSNEEDDEKLDPEVFDDTDYYQQLLRDVIAARGGDGAQAGDQQWQIQQRERKAKRKKTVDTKASKGRKLRYDVHPKLQNFMVPVPVVVGEWHEEQIDGLFSSLLQP